MRQSRAKGVLIRKWYRSKQVEWEIVQNGRNWIDCVGKLK